MARQTPKTDLELDGEHGGESLDGEPLVRLLRNSATLLTGPIFNRNVFRLRKSVDAASACTSQTTPNQKIIKHPRTV